MMERRELTVRFVTPAFLGNAEQRGQWRSPPFKALLRQWWRVAEAPRVGYDHARLREREGRLLGHAWLEAANGRGGRRTWAMKSAVQLRLSDWAPGRLGQESWPGDRDFERVTTTRDGKGKVRADLYLGFGPVIPPSRREDRKAIQIKAPPAIDVRERPRLTLLWPASADPEGALPDALRLIHWFGTLGSRSRNGWGSLEFAHDSDPWPTLPLPGSEVLARASRPWKDCLRCAWPHAIGRDDRGPLVWRSEPRPHWRAAMNLLAHLKVRIRRIAKDEAGRRSGIGGIHLLGYPAGRAWEVPAWGPEARLACPLRLKVVADGSRVRAVVLHVPCTIPEPLHARLQDADRDWLARNEVQVWRRIHEALDGMDDLSRIEA